MKKVAKIFSLILAITVFFSCVTEPQPIFAKAKKADWAGVYTSGSDEDAGILKISKVKDGKFTFSIEVDNGMNTGELKKAVAKISSDKKTATFDNKKGFKIKFVWKNYEIKITESSKNGINPYCGMNVSFEGTYWNSDKLGAS